jgi:hypothetical protein
MKFDPVVAEGRGRGAADLAVALGDLALGKLSLDLDGEVVAVDAGDAGAIEPGIPGCWATLSSEELDGDANPGGTVRDQDLAGLALGQFSRFTLGRVRLRRLDEIDFGI